MSKYKRHGVAAGGINAEANDHIVDIDGFAEQEQL